MLSNYSILKVSVIMKNYWKIAFAKVLIIILLNQNRMLIRF
jgi:hypothetical protein